MADLVFILIVVAFFGLMVLLVRFCDRVIGPDDLASAPESDAGASEAAPTAATEVVS